MNCVIKTHSLLPGANHPTARGTSYRYFDGTGVAYAVRALIFARGILPAVTTGLLIQHNFIGVDESLEHR